MSKNNRFYKQNFINIDQNTIIDAAVENCYFEVKKALENKPGICCVFD